MASSQAGGDPDFTRDDVVDVVDVDDAQDGAVDEVVGYDEGQLDPQWYGGHPIDGEPAFNAFDATTWDINPTAVPWYETRQAMVTSAVVAAAAATLVVSVVLLVVRGPSDHEPALIDNSSTASTPAQTAAPATVAVAPPPVEVPPPPAPPPPPPPAYVPVFNRPANKPEQQAPPTVQVSRNSIAPPPANRGTVNAPRTRSPG
jgi:hypothetical protein